MAEDVFRFKQFSICQSRCAVRVTTDGVLLGAWAEPGSAKRILDIGTGTGLLALMMAQKSANAIIDAVEIDEAAYMQSSDNFGSSPWASRLHAIHAPVQNFTAPYLYDVIISNPPYFKDHQNAPNAQRNIARHNVTLSYKELIVAIDRLLLPDGCVYLVLPYHVLSEFIFMAQQAHLYTAAIANIVAITGREPYLGLLQLKRVSGPSNSTTICIQNELNFFTDTYKQLTADFYLKF